MSESSALFGYLGSMRTAPGRRGEVVAILLEGAGELREHGCHVYAVGVAPEDDVTVWVSEVWDSADAHAASLQLPSVRAAIERAVPMLTGESTGQEVTVLGGLGVPAAP